MCSNLQCNSAVHQHSEARHHLLPCIASPCNSAAAKPKHLAKRRSARGSRGPPHDHQHNNLHVRQCSHAPYFRLCMLSTADTCTTRFTAYQRSSPSFAPYKMGRWVQCSCGSAAYAVPQPKTLNPYEPGVGVGSACEAAAAAAAWWLLLHRGDRLGQALFFVPQHRSGRCDRRHRCLLFLHDSQQLQTTITSKQSALAANAAAAAGP